MITRGNLAEQLRDYQLRSERDWSSLSFWASVNRGDGTAPNRCAIFMVVILLLFGVAGTLYFRDITLTLSLLLIGSALLVCCLAIGNRIAKRKQRRILPQ